MDLRPELLVSPTLRRSLEHHEPTSRIAEHDRDRIVGRHYDTGEGFEGHQGFTLLLVGLELTGDKRLEVVLVGLVRLEVALLHLDQERLCELVVEPTEDAVLRLRCVDEVSPKHLPDEVEVGVLAYALLLAVNDDTHTRLLIRLLEQVSEVVLDIVHLLLVARANQTKNITNDRHITRLRLTGKPTPEVQDTLRSLKTRQEVDVVVGEDMRVSLPLVNEQLSVDMLVGVAMKEVLRINEHHSSQVDITSRVHQLCRMRLKVGLDLLIVVVVIEIVAMVERLYNKLDGVSRHLTNLVLDRTKQTLGKLGLALGFADEPSIMNEHIEGPLVPIE